MRSRSSRWAVTTAVVAILAAAGCGASTGTDTSPGPHTSSSTSKSGGDNEIVFWSWGGTFQSAQVRYLLQPCADKHGYTIKTDENPDVSKIKLADQSNTMQWDIIDVAGNTYEPLAQDGLLSEIDYNSWDADTLKQVPEQFREKYGVSTALYSQGIAYRTDLGMTKHPTTWAEFWDTKTFPGARAIPTGTFADPPYVPALLANGVKTSDLYPLDFDRAFDSLDKIRPDVSVWYSATAAGVQALVNGDVDYAMLPNGRVQQAADEGAKVAFEYASSLTRNDFLVIPKKAPHSKAAQTCLAEMQSKAASLNFMKNIPYGMPNTAANDALPADLQVTMPTAKKNLDKQIPIDVGFFAKKATDGGTWLDYATKRWTTWYTG